mmetsp:Transcript_53194/g.64107  ORF Transcript_53194/g.64107 Transcript_53194/m.64107 type:complete len:568 (+) Transcript_53194:78-1781(+)
MKGLIKQHRTIKYLIMHLSLVSASFVTIPKKNLNCPVKPSYRHRVKQQYQWCSNNILPPKVKRLQSEKSDHNCLPPSTSKFNTRRSFITSSSLGLSSSLIALTNSPQPCGAGSLLSTAVRPISIALKSLSSEACLLALLPVSNYVFRSLQRAIEDLSFVQTSVLDDIGWQFAARSSESALSFLDAQRSQLQPSVTITAKQEEQQQHQNSDKDTNELTTAAKTERSEKLLKDLRTRLQDLVTATSNRDTLQTYYAQKKALLALASIGELLVPEFPHAVPEHGEYSLLPRLKGRAVVTFRMVRNGRKLGDVTIVADGFAAPITAGNFVDLCRRGFYNGLPLNKIRKKLGGGGGVDDSIATATASATATATTSSNGGESGRAVSPPSFLSQLVGWGDMNKGKGSGGEVDLPILGSFKEGFYDPITARLRRLPLEYVTFNKMTGTTKASYPESRSVDDDYEQLVLTFSIPGLVGMNHPDSFPNSASSEFFLLPENVIRNEKVNLLDRNYAPFGYIVEGFEIAQQLQPGDVIAKTSVDDWGLMNLVRLRETSFSAVAKETSSNENAEDELES